MKTKFLILSVIGILFFLQACEEPVEMELKSNKLIPLPNSIESTGTSFLLDGKTQFVVDSMTTDAKNLSTYFIERIENVGGFKMLLKVKPGLLKKYVKVQFGLINDNPEAYEIEIQEKYVLINAVSAQGAFRAFQTLFQLLPDELYAKSKNQKELRIPTGKIIDAPYYSYRSAMLDVSRHFFSVEDVKSYIDWLAMYKMNYLHLHLTDDQGWRIEIKKWPDLTKIGGKTEVGGGEGGFFTQEDYKEIVKYASDRYITIVPEIDMPGHTNAALVSYAELNCDGKKRKPYTGMRVGFSTLCTDKEIVYQFVDDVIGELAAMTPGPYIHIGGDESHSTEKNDYIYFVNRVQDIVNKYGKQMMGWDEIVTAKLNETSVVHAWRSKENAQAAAKQNLKILMSPAKFAYLDMKYDENTKLGLTWAGSIEVDHAYKWNPEDLFKGVKKENIIGVECPLWSETVTNIDEVEFLVFPRLPGYAEIGWTNPDYRKWKGYKERLANQQKRFELLGINYYKSPKIEWQE